MAPGLAPVIAVVGADGSGKSTLSADLIAWLGQTRPTQGIYLGLGSGTLGSRIRAWPIIGPALEGHLRRKADRARDRNDRIPGLATALVLYAYSKKRRRRFQKLLDLRRRGIIVVTDRYPQTEIPGYYDGPGLSAARAEGWLMRWLASRERRIYEQMASYLPALVIRLVVDVDTAMARKPDHDRNLIARKVAATTQLCFGGALLIDLDATGRYSEVLELAKRAISAVIV